MASDRFPCKDIQAQRAMQSESQRGKGTYFYESDHCQDRGDHCNDNSGPFAALLPVSTFGSCFVCIFLALGYLLLLAGFHSESCEERKAAATAGLLFGCIYAVLILLVYFTQLTAVKNDPLNEQSAMLLDFSKGGLFFGYDLLGYGMMALSTFFTGLTLRPEDRKDKWLKCLMMLHGVFFCGCLLMPMTGIFRTAMSDGNSPGGIIALECWCAYFLPISVLSALHFKKAS